MRFLPGGIVNYYLNGLWGGALDGRVNRRAFWRFTLLDSLFLAIIAIMGLRAAHGDYITIGDTVAMLLFFIYPTVSLPPRIAIGIRRLHDTGRSGWWTLLWLVPPAALLLIYWLARPGESGENRFGPGPEAEPGTEGGLVKCYLDAFRHAGFAGRSGRLAFWIFTLVDGAILATAAIAVMLTDRPEIYNKIIGGALIYLLVTSLPRIAVAVRRLHDTGRSGWWILLALLPGPGTLALLYWFILDGEPAANRYGTSPALAPARVYE